ncbi:MAG: hypothetical protein JWQ81_1313 [Amycolatopsis sp.]|uniref:hypothetical protein n=1 Tax=Amycolatopsis sp. TaxID=37632 RepID=UPI00260B0D98|nr:hypothetical protein [Amycolatopsis sp.]MCU1680574.1 hypothetical protein [Amycolatopsis sp.]
MFGLSGLITAAVAVGSTGVAAAAEEPIDPAAGTLITLGTAAGPLPEANLTGTSSVIVTGGHS